jgi:tetratricopeptide (TPR) repeat protein
VPRDLDEGGLLDAYLHRLAGEVFSDTDRRIAGVADWLDRLGTLMLERRAPMLPMSIADQWADEWRKSLGFDSVLVATKLDPIEELAAASVLLRPAEAGFGFDRERIGYQFTHQKLAERVLLRALERRIAPRTLPTREELSHWTAHAAGDPPFAELSGALAEWVHRLTIAGEGETLTCLLDIDDDSTRKTLMTSLIMATAIAPAKDAETVLDRLAQAARTHEEGRARFLETAWEASFRLAEIASLAAARRVFSSFRAFSEHLATAEPGNILAQRHLAVFCDQLGGLALAAGDTTTARAWFERELEIDEGLATADPSNVKFQHDLSISCDRLGDLAKAGDDTATARAWFERGLNIRKALKAADPSNVKFQHALSFSYDRLGDLAKKAGDTATARDWFDRGLNIREVLANTDPSNVAFQHALPFSYDRLGDLAREAGDTAAARTWFERGLNIREVLATTDASNVQFQRALSISYDRLGDLAKAAGDTATARAWFERRLKIDERLTADAENLEYQRELAVSHLRIAELAESEHDVTSAKQHFTSAMEIIEALPQNALTASGSEELLSYANRVGEELSRDH